CASCSSNKPGSTTGEVRSRDVRVGETAHRAHGDTDADEAEARAQHGGSMAGARQPHTHDRRCRPLGTDAPGERLSEHRAVDAVPTKPPIPVAVGEVTAPNHRPRMGPGRALEADSDTKRYRPMGGPRVVDRPEQALFSRGQALERSRLRRCS